jgi:hypothetical protein
LASDRGDDPHAGVIRTESAGSCNPGVFNADVVNAGVFEGATADSAVAD